MADSPEGSDKGLNRSRTWTALLALTSVVAGIAYYNWKPGDDTATPPDPSLRRKLELKGEACGVLVRIKDRLPRIASNRRELLEKLSVLGRCTDPNAVEFNFQGVCTQITEGIKSSTPKWKHPILNPFYVMLYDELKCARNERGDDLRPEIDALFKALESTDAIKQYRLLDADLKIDEICNDATDFIKFPPNIQAIRDLTTFILSKAPSLAPESNLRQIVERSRKSFQDSNDGRLPSDQELSGVIESYLSIATTVVKIPLLCKLPVESLIALFDKKKRLTPELLSEKRRLALPIIRELIAALKDSPDNEETRKAQAALLHLAQSLSAQKKR